MPPAYSAAVVFWLTLLFALMICAACVYCAIAKFAVSGIALMFKSANAQDLILLLLVAILLAGAGLLVLLVKAAVGSTRNAGVRIPLGAAPALEELVRSCAARAGVPDPEGLFVTTPPEATAYASGILRSRRRLNSVVSIGAPVLANMDAGVLEAVLYHEYGHLKLRRGQWAVDLDNKTHDCVTLFKSAQRQVAGFVSLIGLVPAMLIGGFEWIRGLTMMHFSRKEELLVDGFAATCLRPGEFPEKLALAITCLTALMLRRGKTSVLDEIQAEYHRRLMRMERSDFETEAPQWPNYFDVVREKTDDVRARLLPAREYLENQVTRSQDTHPSLRDRMLSLGADLDDAPIFSRSIKTVPISPKAERLVSEEFATRLRYEFYGAKRKLTGKPDDGLENGKWSVYTCGYPKCPRFGKPELGLSLDSLLIWTRKGDIEIPWRELQSVSDGTSDIITNLVNLVRRFAGAVAGAPFVPAIQLHTIDGRTFSLAPRHLTGSIEESQEILKVLWKRAQERTQLVKPSATMGALILLLRCLAVSVVFAVIVIGFAVLAEQFPSKEKAWIKDTAALAAFSAMVLTWKWSGRIAQRWTARRVRA